MVTRREFIAGTALSASVASFGLVRLAPAAPPVLRLDAKPGTAHLLEAGQPETPIWGYNGRVPGTAIRTRQGEPFAADLHNSLPQPTTIHWHGIRNINAMDGVANLTQPAVPPGGTFAYRFTPPDAGTYWYHPHNRTWEQLARGLYGPFIVEERRPPPVDQDLVLVFDDWRIGDDGAIHEASLGNFHDLSHAGRLGNILTLNGAFAQDIPVKAGQRLRLRLISAANARIIAVRFTGHAPRVVALDGQPVEPFAPKNNLLSLAPAQRADLILDCAGDVGSSAPIQVETGGETLEIGKLIYHASERQRATVLSDAFHLPANPMPAELDHDAAVSIDLDMTGGAMAWFQSAEYRGKTYDVRTLAREHRKVWAFNGIAGMPEKPLARFAAGKTVHVRMKNRTAWPHAMHFHGHHVREISHSARKPLPHWRDTVFMARDEEITVAFRAHNPGKWMLHCHMLAHQAGGMSTWYEVG
ncbi:MAG: multicopper oxidase family protein [Hyphomicrobiaceae bacterium]